MTIHRTLKNKKTPNYNFLISWEPKQARVKGESKKASYDESAKSNKPKSADVLAKDQDQAYVKKNVLRSVVLVSLVLSLELVVYLAWNNFFK